MEFRQRFGRGDFTLLRSRMNQKSSKNLISCHLEQLWNYRVHIYRKTNLQKSFEIYWEYLGMSNTNNHFLVISPRDRILQWPHIGVKLRVLSIAFSKKKV